MWKKILEKMYEQRDAASLHENIRTIIANRVAEAQDGTATAQQRKLSREQMSN